jgi:drug/metabolite transporter (DMT)-like permease
MASPAPLAGPLLMLLSTCFFTGANLLIKRAMADFGIWDVGFYRFTGGLLLLLLLFGRRGNPFRSDQMPLLIVRGCSGTAAFLAYIFAVARLPVSTALMLLYAYPAFAALFAARLYREPVARSAWGCLAAVLLGVALLVDPDFTGPGDAAAGYLAGILAALCAGLTIAIVRHLKQRNGSVVITLYFCAVGAAACAAPFCAAPTLPGSAAQAAVIGGIVLLSLLGQLVMNRGFDHCRSWEGGLYMTSEVVMTALAGILLLGEPTGWRFWTGGALILGGAMAVQRVRRGGGKEVRQAV